MQRGSHRAAGRYQRHKPAPWFTRLRALLAGALVLGVGATLTLASWTDQEHSKATFTTSYFGILGSTSNEVPVPPGSFLDHPSGSPAVLAFSAPVGTMSPNTTVYARFAIKTTAPSNVTGKITLAGAAAADSGLGPYLRYGVKVIPSGSLCNAASFDAVVATSEVMVPPNSALNVAGTLTPTVGINGSNSVAFCFAVTLPQETPNAAQGLTSTPVWVFTATSDS